MTRVFLSYCREDIAEVTRLRDDLIAQGIDVWWDRDLGSGQDLEIEIGEAMRQSGAVILCLSGRFQQRTRSFVYKEIREAIAEYRQRPPGDTYLIPVRISECQVPRMKIDDVLTLNGLLVTDLFPEKRWKEGIQELVAALARVSHRPPPRTRPDELAQPQPQTSVLPVESSQVQTRAQIQKLLERLGRIDRTKFDALRALERELRPDDEDSELAEGENPIPIILEALVDRRKLSSIEALSHTYKECCGAGNWDAATLIAEIVDHLTPLVIDPELTSLIWNQIKNQKAPLFLAPVNRAAAVEALLARIDGKRMNVPPPVCELPAEDFDGSPSLRFRKAPVGAPGGPEALARDLLLDLCASHDVPDAAGHSRSLEELAKRFAAILLGKKMGPNRGRTLYCFHKLPADPKKAALHTAALDLIRSKLNEIKNVPELIFVVLAKTSDIEMEQTVIIRVLNTRFRHERNRTTGHATNT